MNEQQDNPDQQNDSACRRQFHQQCLEQSPDGSHELSELAASLDIVPLDVRRVELVTGFSFGDELSPELMEFEPFADLRPECAKFIRLARWFRWSSHLRLVERRRD